MRYSSPSQRIARTLGLQQTWQSSIYFCLPPPDSSTTVSFHSPQPAHWKPASMGMATSVKTRILVYRKEREFASIYIQSMVLTPPGSWTCEDNFRPSPSVE